MIVTIHQPDFLPWLGFFDRWRRSDLYVVLDDVQFIRRGWQHRDRIKTAQGVKWLTLPVVKKGKYEQLIKDVELDQGQNWRKKHLGTLAAAYGKAPNFKSVMADIEKIYNQANGLMIDLNMSLLMYCSKVLGIDAPLVRSSTLGVTSTGARRILELVEVVGGDVYLTGTGSRSYLDETMFQEAGVEVVWQEFEHPVYDQLHGPFEPMLSVIDYLMMDGSPLVPAVQVRRSAVR